MCFNTQEEIVSYHPFHASCSAASTVTGTPSTTVWIKSSRNSGPESSEQAQAKLTPMQEYQIKGMQMGKLPCNHTLKLPTNHLGQETLKAQLRSTNYNTGSPVHPRRVSNMNQTTIYEIYLRGFENIQTFKGFLFVLFLVIFMVTLIGNLLIIIAVSTSYRLQSPMFFFLGHLSFSDMLLTTNIVPNMLYLILLDGAIVSISACISQFFFYGVSATTECLLLTAMSYDRYIAICNPLHYSTVMDLRLCLYLIIWSWSLGFVITLIPLFFLRMLWFCGPNIIDHFFCDLGPLLELSCSDTTIIKYEVFTFSSLLTIVPFIFISVTYINIFLTIMRIPSITGKQKAFSTCSSHLTVVCTYYGALFAMYVVPSRGYSLNINKVVSLMYTVVTPLFNPIIYSLRNQEIKAVLLKYLWIKRSKM
ncbi:olfactory receptor 5G25-like [Pelobates fuscus]|uniref:olfactory receptor 5G25-like n=1 Tax=Pelobates fuscus TaxID=191477 RepID=UPI002FE46FA2